jgi:hypothetical protein
VEAAFLGAQRRVQNAALKFDPTDHQAVDVPLVENSMDIPVGLPVKPPVVLPR